MGTRQDTVIEPAIVPGGLDVLGVGMRGAADGFGVPAGAQVQGPPADGVKTERREGNSD